MKSVFRGLSVLVLLLLLGLSLYANYRVRWAEPYDDYNIAKDVEIVGGTTLDVGTLSVERQNSMGKPSPAILERRLLDPKRQGEQWLPHA